MSDSYGLLADRGDRSTIGRLSKEVVMLTVLLERFE